MTACRSTTGWLGEPASASLWKTSRCLTTAAAATAAAGYFTSRTTTEVTRDAYSLRQQQCWYSSPLYVHLPSFCAVFTQIVLWGFLNQQRVFGHKLRTVDISGVCQKTAACGNSVCFDRGLRQLYESWDQYFLRFWFVGQSVYALVAMVLRGSGSDCLALSLQRSNNVQQRQRVNVTRLGCARFVM